MTAPHLIGSAPLELRLEVTAGPHKGRTFTCSGHENFLVGRSNRAHFRLPKADQFFSRLHFMIETNPPCCRLFDMNSTNGTCVNGKKATAVDLRDGDLIQGGDTVIKVALIGNWSEARDIAAVSSRPSLNDSMDKGSEATQSFHPELSALTAVTKHLPPDWGAKQKLPAIDGCRVLKELGRGGMGIVYLAMSNTDRIPVAIKTLKPAVVVSQEEADRFLREADILQKLQHPRIVRFHASGKGDGFLYFVMEYVEGTDAAAIIKDRGPMPINRAVRLVCQLLDALQYAHDQGIVHRDVKPANLLVTANEECKLADFGLARAYYASSLSGLTMMGQVGGTPPYMPPEQITDYRHALPCTDQYAAAATLYYLLTGSHVYDFEDLSPAARLTKILSEDPVPITNRRADVPQALADAIHRALRKEPKERFASAAQLKNVIDPLA